MSSKPMSTRMLSWLEINCLLMLLGLSLALQYITHVHVGEVLGMGDFKWDRAETCFQVEAESLT